MTSTGRSRIMLLSYRRRRSHGIVIQIAVHIIHTPLPVMIRALQDQDDGHPKVQRFACQQSRKGCWKQTTPLVQGLGLPRSSAVINPPRSRSVEEIGGGGEAVMLVLTFKGGGVEGLRTR